MATKIIIVFISLMYSMIASAEYQPAFSFEKYVKTITVHADGTNEVIQESIDKIETEKGVKAGSQSDLSYINGMQTIEILDAYTITPEGKKIRVGQDNIRERDDPTNNGADMFSDTKHKIMIYPEVTVGAKLYAKTKETNFKTQFQNHFVYSEVTLPYFKYGSYEINFIVDKPMHLNFDSKGFVGGLVKETKDQNIYKYTYKQNTAVSAEPEMVSLYDVSNYLVVSSFNDYAEFASAYQALAHPKSEPKIEVKKLAYKIVADAKSKDKKEEAKALYEWIVKNVRYVAVYIGNGGIEPHDVSEIIKNKYGDCKDHAVLYEALLAARGIESSPATINLGDAFTLPKYPVIAPQNHVITYIPQFDLYVDATAQSVPFGIVPFYDRDKPTVLTALNKIGKTPSMKASENLVKTTVKLKIQPDGSIDGASHIDVTGPIESSYRENQVPNVGKDDTKIVTDMLSMFGETGSGKLSFTLPTDFDKKFEENGVFKLDPISNFPGPAAMTVPVGLTEGRIFGISKEKPLEKRTYPFRCFGRTYTDTYEIKFPEKTIVTKLPEGLSYNADGYSYQSKYSIKDNVVSISRVMVLDHEKMFCGPELESRKKAFFNILQRDLRSQIFYE